ncbi:DUF4145 domain-containing protein [Actinosynnema sp. CS-041913]|uniref:DUF4145 domain-containing protein n=1 Tax=Actinosynnema sp. CS-041913 TaxID=3239917 RepID=UPI003D8AEAEF
MPITPESRSSEVVGKIIANCFICDDPGELSVYGFIAINQPDIGHENVRYTLSQCTRCGDVALLQQKISPQRFDGWSTPERVWPWEEGYLNNFIPSAIRNEMTQARNCFKHQAYTAAVVMVRRTLEGVCADHSINERTLISSLRKMEERKIIDGQLVEWTTELRTLGNTAAHYTGEALTKQDAQDALALAEALLDYVYFYSRKFADFKQRRQSNSDGVASDENLP